MLTPMDIFETFDSARKGFLIKESFAEALKYMGYQTDENRVDMLFVGHSAPHIRTATVVTEMCTETLHVEKKETDMCASYYRTLFAHTRRPSRLTHPPHSPPTTSHMYV